MISEKKLKLCVFWFHLTLSIKQSYFIGLFQGMDDAQVRSAATDIFSYLVEYNPSMVREFVMQEAQQNDDVSREFSEMGVLVLKLLGFEVTGVYLQFCE